MEAALASQPDERGGPDRRTSRRGRWAAVAMATGALALTAACGPYGGTSTAASSAPAATGSATGALATAPSSFGTIVVDDRGRTVYDFANDTGGTSTCTGGCAAIWPPVVAPDPLPGSLPGLSGPLGSTTRSDGTRQLTIAGHPLYTYSGDDAPGQTTGQGVNLNGGVWTVVSPAGSPVTAGAAPAGGDY
jgi:predicted lipoprotein with Yx(FWY)xxD motif